MSGTSIVRVHGRRVWDSRGRPTVEAEVHLADGAVGRAIAPAGASVGAAEALELRDGGTALGGLGVQRAIANVNGEIANAVRGLDAGNQESVDQALIEADGTPNKGRLGANALVSVSMACAHAAAAAHGMPLWRFILGDGAPELPLPEIQIFGGGAHAGGRVDVQDFMVVPLGAASFAEALVWSAEVYRAAGKRMSDLGLLRGVADEGGFWPDFPTNEAVLEMLVRSIEDAGLSPGDQVGISLDIAASEFFADGRYHLKAEDRILESEGLHEMIAGWIGRYPIVSVEDPLAEEDHDGMRKFTEAVGQRVQVVGDDYLVTNADRVAAAAQRGACNAILIKPNQAGTLSEAKAALDAARRLGFGAICSARSGETEDVTIVHLAVGWGVPQLKVGSFSRSERMAKWNECLRIEEALGPSARFAGARALAVQPKS